MTRLKTPLLGFQAQGSVGDILSFRRRGTTTIAEKKPVPADRKTLLQLYQRWRYQDALIAWEALPDADKAAYKRASRAHNYTSIAEFLASYLPAPTNQTLYMPFNEGSDITTLDLSPNAWSAILFGPTWQAGFKNDCLKGDGANDYVLIGKPPAIYTPSGTIEMVVKLPALPATGRALISSDLPGFNPGEFNCYANAARILGFQVTHVGGEAWAQTDAPLSTDVWHHLQLLWGTQGVLMCIDGVDQIIRDPDTRPIGNANPIFLFCRYPTAMHSNAFIDELHFYDKDLSPAERVARAHAYGFI